MAYLAPRATYGQNLPPRERLSALMGELALQPREVVDADPVTGARLAAYWKARTQFLAIGGKVQPSADVRQMLAQVQQPLLEVLRISPDFRPAFDPLMQMATALSRSDAEAARILLAELATLQSARIEANNVLPESIARLK